ncbi:MAG: N-6 DNA methylase [Chloroflexi bacterium]|nr:N-6 DNA methylase [Chloroflexota bacterium]MCY3581369.1 N-6 DNA methylase [Chloroflexota bacterium]MCY3717754.1 N-6 DNA methylase [Chloroflexota bacterium]MDE2651977.1 N-6 DNA methylase [Chloroflexota bacterium]MXX51956.1 N-6 DNA methylase [Chloroflexota bacterium]
MIESDVRYQIDRSLEATGWILEAGQENKNVFFEESVKLRLSANSIQKLGQKRPDYTLFDGASPIAIVEAKKASVSDLGDALKQASDYAERIGVDFVFACNGLTVKSLHVSSGLPLYLNGIEVTEFPDLQLLQKFRANRSNQLFTVPKKVLKSRTELIRLFAELNDDLRAEGLRAGIERFSEFANILFLKLLSEKGEDEIWQQLLRLREQDILLYLNKVAMEQLRENYGGEVITGTAIRNPKTLKRIVLTLNALQLSDIDEDIKGVAFEHFIQKTTDTQNDLGEYFTPRHIIRFMVRLLDPQYGENVYDPFCGTGGFLTETFRHISHQCRLTIDALDTLNYKTVFGGEITTTARIAKMNMILFGDGHSGVNQQDSLRTNSEAKYNNVLSNIPFSQRITQEVLNLVGGTAQYVRHADEACVLKCFNSLKLGGSMAVVVPEGLLVNRQHKEFLRFLLRNSTIRMLIRLPRGCFAPYTDAKTGIIFLTDKGLGQTEWFYRVTIKNDGYDSKRQPIPGINDLDSTLFFFRESAIPLNTLPESLDVSVVSVQNLASKETFYLHTSWKLGSHKQYVKLEDVAILRNGTSITKATTMPGDIPVIAGGRGTVPYTHGEYNYSGRIFTISKSGAYSGYVWWHDDPIWASDCIVVRSKDESKYLTRYLYMCMALKQAELYERQQGTGQPHVYISLVRDFPIPVITIERQRRLLQEYEEAQEKLRKLNMEIRTGREKIDQALKSFYE